uniref:Uncharacterized protein n=1 Tax=Tetraselmis sp. GSL018 TaxID=582737 RepID=A0A061RS80_9CHLO|mmetsp:Transcript_37393/g.88871  ORF Transcript_37393/g.88871 Transcript_37393/m.88871 type:complete len:167 (-) Transcript_37393:109-609(-)
MAFQPGLLAKPKLLSVEPHFNKGAFCVRSKGVISRRRLCCRAKFEGRPEGEVNEDDEARLEAIEKASRRRRKGSAEYSIDELRYSAKALSAQESQSAAAEWKEGKLLPEGWESMNAFEKFYNLYMGKRGLLFWANKAAFASVFILIGAWIVFRFIGPSLGLYKVAE